MSGEAKLQTAIGIFTLANTSMSLSSKTIANNNTGLQGL